jgi:hypothetical protein
MSDNGDSFTETTRESWFSRLGGALTGLLLGLILIPGGGFLLFWNEGRAVQTARSLAEGAGLVVAVAADSVDRAREGRLIHVSGALTIPTPPRDADFTLAAPAGTLRLFRQVEMYQWQEESRSETRNRLGGGTETVTTYSYSRVWHEGRIDSSRFRQPDGHQNPQPRFTSRSWNAENVRLGAFRLEAAQINDIDADQDMGEPSRYIGPDANTPRVGDQRVSWRIARPESLSIVAAQTGDGFGPYATRAGDRLMMVRPGRMPAAAMFAAAEEENAILTWILRAVGTVLIFVAFSMLFAPLKVLADVIPPLGWLVGFGTGLLAAVLTLVLAPLIIAVAWLTFRPLLAGAILLAGLAGAFGISRLRRGRVVAKPA